MELIDGKNYSKNFKENLKSKFSAIKEKYGYTAGLAVVIVGNNPASEIYVRNKIKASEELGINSIEIKLEESVSQEVLESEVKKLVEREDVNGILVQLPLPKHLNGESVLKLIPPEKDVDGFSAYNMGKLVLGQDTYPSCTPAGIIELLKGYNVKLEGKHAVVIGRSNIVGKPVAAMLLKENCTVTICHSKTENLKEITRLADVLVVAIGQANFVTADMVKDGVVVIDVGMNRVDGKLYGDVDFESVSKKCSLITPVPGGVGPMTITMLMNNTYKSFIKSKNINEF